MVYIFCKKENPRISEDETSPSTLSNLNIRQDILNPPSGGDPALANPGIEFFPVEVVRLTEFWTNG